MADRKETIIIDVQVNDVKRQLGETAKAIFDLKEQNKALKKEQKDGTADWTESTATIKANEAQIKLLAAAEKSLEGQLRASTSENKKYGNSNVELRAQVADLERQYNSLTDAQKNTAAGKELLKQQNDLKAAVKGNAEELGNFQDSVGNYAKGTEGLASAFSKMPGVLGKVGGAVEDTTVGFQAMNTASPVGWIQIAIQVIAGLIQKFSSFAPVSDAITNGLAKLSAAFDVLKNGVIAVITGQKSLGEVISGASGEMTKQIKEAERLAEAQRDLEDRTEASTISQEKYKNQVNQLLLQSKNRTLSEKQRMKLIDDALALENKAYAERKKLADDEVKLLQDNIIKQGGLNKFEASELRKKGVAYARYKENKKNIDDQAIKDLASALVTQQSIEGESISLREKAMNRRDQLEDKAKEAAEKKAAADKLAAAEKTAADKLAAAEKAAADQKAEDDRLKALKKASDDAIALLDYELEMERLKQEERLAGQKLTDEQVYANRNAALQANAANEILVLQEKLKSEELTQTEFNSQKLLLEQKLKTDLALSDAEYEALKIENRNISAANDLQNELAIADMKGQSLLDLKLQQLEVERLAELEAAEKTGADTFLIEQKYAEAKKALNRAEISAKMDMASGFAGNIAEIFGKQTKVGKMAASAQIAIDTAKGAMAAFTSMASIPVVGPALGAAAAGALIAKGIKSGKDVWAVKSGLPGDGGGGGGGNIAPAPAVSPSLAPTPATKGADLVLNSSQAGSLNNKLAAGQPQSGGIDYDLLAKSMSSQPAPVMVYSEFKNFEEKVTNFDEQIKI